MRLQYTMAGLGLAVLVAAPALVTAQQAPLPLGPQRAAGVGISPVYEGWYRNPDGTYSLSFGFQNRNLEETLDIPAGVQNHIEGATPIGGLPSHFPPRRHYGVFTVTVPATFGANDKVVWTLDVRGRKFAIPGRLHPLYEIDALGAPATGDTPPILRLAEDGPDAQGPHGVTAGPLRAKVGQALPVTAWVTDEQSDAVTVRWSKWAGPGTVAFADDVQRTSAEAQHVTTNVTFGAPGSYVLYVRTQTASLSGAGHEQCCWTNGYVKVDVSR